MKKRFTALAGVLTAAALTFSLTTPALAIISTPKPVTEAPVEFTDLKGYSWAKEAITTLSAEGIVVGDGKGRFNPEETMRRADYIMILVNAFDLEIYSRDSFVDVKRGAYYYDYISTAKERGVLKEVRDNRFYPEEAITRQDAMVYLYRALQCKRIPMINSTDLNAFSDANELDREAVSSVGALVNAGIVSGIDGKIKPTTTMSRAEIACLLYRAVTELDEFWVH